MVYLINLDSAVERRARMEAQLAALGVACTRVGYDGRGRSPAAIAAWAATRFPHIEFDFDALSGAEVGCWLSHLGTWQALAQDAQATTCTVLEDDVVLDPALAMAIGDIARHAPFDVTYLGTSSRNISTRRHVRAGHCMLHEPVGTVLNTWGYVIRRDFAQRFLAEPRRLRLPIDRHLGAGLRHAGARIAVLQPAAVCEDPEFGVQSQIEPFTFRADRWKVVESARRRLLASRVSAMYYALYRWL